MVTDSSMSLLLSIPFSWSFPLDEDSPFVLDPKRLNETKSIPNDIPFNEVKYN